MMQNSLRVLLVEDSPTDSRLFQHVFFRASEENWSLEFVERLSEAIDSCQMQSFDLVLLDLNLPDSDGLNTVAKFSQAVPNVPIIILTGFDDEELALQAMSKGAQDYLVKDQVTTHLLRRSIRYSIERSQILQQLRDSEQVTLQSLAKERELNQLKSYFISMVSHEFRNPLNILKAMSEVLLESGDRLTIEKKEIYAQRIESTIQNMCQLLDEVILLGRVDTGSLAIALTPMNLAEFCDELITSLKLSDDNQHPIILNYQLASKFLEMDASLLSHILTNLISNALKYSPFGNEVEIEVSSLDGKIMFCVSDRGIGIPEADQDRLFKTFSRCSNVGKIKGTGLGLAIVKRCVDLWGGKIYAESKSGIGTKVTVLLPMGEA